MTVCVDVDGVLNELQESFIQYVENIGFRFNYDYCNYYDLSKGIMASRDEQKHIQNTIFTDDYFWLTLSPSMNSYVGLKYLNDNFNVFITTQPYDEHNKNVKLTWLSQHFPFINQKQVIFSDTKWHLSGDIIIEDKPHTLERCLEHDWIAIKKLQPYNIQSNASYELHNWNEIENIMKGII